MKTLLMTALFIAFSMGVSKIIKTSEETGNSYAVSTIDVLQEVLIDDAVGTCELRQEFNKSAQVFTESVKQTTNAIVDLIVTIVAYAGFVVTQTIASIVFD